MYFYPQTDRDFSGLLLTGFVVLHLLNLYANGTALLKDRKYQDTSITGYLAEVGDSIDYVQKYDHSLYRMEQTFHYSNNDAMLFSYRGLTHFSSTEQASVLDFMGNMGYAKNLYRAMYGEGATLAGDSLLGVKYLLSRGEVPLLEPFYHDNTVLTYYNPYALPFGFLCQPGILKEMEWKENPFENQNMIYSALTGKKENVLKPLTIELESYGMTYNTSEKSWESDKDASTPCLRLTFTTENEYPVYLYLNATGQGSAVAYLNGKKRGDYLNNETNGILSLGTFQPGETIEILLYPSKTSITMDEAYVTYLDVPAFEEQIDILQSGAWYLYDSTDTKIKAEVMAEEDSVLFLSIPYDKNWNITMDGVKTEPEQVMDLFMAVRISRGTHQITLRYKNPAISFGSMITLCCTFLSLLLIIVENRKHRNKAPKRQMFRATT